MKFRVATRCVCRHGERVLGDANLASALDRIITSG